MTTPEGKVQAYIITSATTAGGLVRKIAYEGRAGCPDLLVLLPHSVVLFIEVKKNESTKPAPHQEREIARMRARGALVYVVGSTAQFDAILKRHLSIGM